MEEKTANSLANFIKYNNAVPIALGLLFFATSGALAASPEVRDSVYSSSQSVQSVDNSYIRSVNLDSYPFSFRVTGVTEDDDNYYVAYEFHTIDVINAVWRDIIRVDTLTVNKTILRGGDLRAYTEAQFADLQSHELDRLTQTQDKQRQFGLSQKVVATAYSGLIGQMLTTDKEALPAYVPPPAKQDPDSPLALENPTPLVTWDENAATTTPDGGVAGATGHVVTHSTSVIIINPDGSMTTITGTSTIPTGGGGSPPDTGSSTPPDTGGGSPPNDGGAPPPPDTGGTETPPTPPSDAPSGDAGGTDTSATDTGGGV